MDRPLLNQGTFLFTLAICCIQLSYANAFQYTIPTTLEVENAYTLKAVAGAQIIVKQKESDGKYYSYGIYHTDSMGIINLSINEGKVYTVTTKKENYYTQITVLSTDDISRVGKNKFGLSMRPKDCYRIQGKVNGAISLDLENYIILQNRASNASERIDINSKGYYYACATCGQNYLMISYLNGKEYQADSLDLNEETCRGKRNPLLEWNIVPKEIKEEPIVELIKEAKAKYYKGDSMVLTQLVFEGKKQNTDDKGREVLNSLCKDLLEYPDLTIELKIHTDTRKSERYNWLLSKKRGAYMEGYLEEKGIESSRYTITPVGEAEILNDCSNGKPCSKEEHAVNNRVELRIL